MLKREYEFAREKVQTQLQSQHDGTMLGGNSSYRRQSYVNLALLAPDSSEIVEEQPSGDSGSTKNAKKTAPVLFEANASSNSRSMQVSNSAVELGQNRSANLTASQQSFTEDP